MKYKILGLQEIKFPNKETGEMIEGVKLHLVTEFEEDYIHGHSVLSQFFSNKRFFSKVTVGTADRLLGKTINLEFNQKGKIGDFEIIETPAK